MYVRECETWSLLLRPPYIQILAPPLHLNMPCSPHSTMTNSPCHHAWERDTLTCIMHSTHLLYLNRDTPLDDFPGFSWSHITPIVIAIDSEVCSRLIKGSGNYKGLTPLSEVKIPFRSFPALPLTHLAIDDKPLTLIFFLGFTRTLHQNWTRKSPIGSCLTHTFIISLISRW